MTATPDTGAGRDWADDPAKARALARTQDSHAVFFKGTREPKAQADAEFTGRALLHYASHLEREAERLARHHDTPPRDDGGAGRDLEEGK